MIRSYHELSRINSFVDRFRYLSLKGRVGETTFGFDRWMNQRFYGSKLWQQARQYVILRDNGCDLGVEGHEIHQGLYIHHMNPIVSTNLSEGDEDIIDPEFLITTCHRTHNAIHYGDESLLPKPFEPRRRGDTKLW